MSTTGPLTEFVQWAWETAPAAFLLLFISLVLMVVFSFVWGIVYCFAPLPRPPYESETFYESATPDGSKTRAKLPCWQYKWLAQQDKNGEKATAKEPVQEVEKAQVFLTVVVPAYNEEKRLSGMLEETLGVLAGQSSGNKTTDDTSLRKRKTTSSSAKANGITSSFASASTSTTPSPTWEILVVSDGSKDNTTSVALDYAKQYASNTTGSIRVITLKSNRGKGGAVTHGLRHARGEYVMFADADGASKFSDAQKLIQAAEGAKDAQGRAVAVGSRAHLVGSEAVVQRSKLRNFLMHSFHLLLYLLTPRATSRIKDTQCGFKLFTRQALPYIVPHMHSEGWIFDVEMLMLAERAGIPMVEVPVGWHEVTGSKLNVVWDSLGMAWGLAILRMAWGMGVYQL